MVSDKPPRRSRSGKTPVTIDMAAEEARPVAEPVRSNDTDTVDARQTPDEDTSGQAATSLEAKGTEGAPTESERAAEPMASDSAAPAEDRTPDDIARADEAPATVPGAAGAPDGTTDAGRPDEASSDASLPPRDTPAADAPVAAASAPPTEPEARPAEPRAKGTSGAAIAASGIIGGLVALLLAGSMQYAGYLPGLNSQPAATTSAELEDLRQQVAELRNRPATPDAELTARLEALEANADTAPANEELQQRLTSLQSEIEGLKTSTESATTGTAQLGERLSALETEVNRPGPEQAVARALAAAALKAATERGGSFAAELQIFAQVAPDDPAVNGLQAYAEQGVPTRAELARRLPSATRAILNALEKPDEGEGIAARLMSSALNVVKIRPVGEVEGDTPEAVLARFEERVKNGDLKAAVSEWNALPEAAKQASSDFKQALDARIDVEELMNGTLTRAMTSAGSNG